MSRSFRKYPLIKARESGKFAKKMTNKKIRQDSSFSGNHALYRRMYDSIELKDYCFVETLEEAIQEWESNTQAILNGCKKPWYYKTYHPTLKQVIADWKAEYHFR